MIPDRYSCADVDGVFCIKHETTDYCSPLIVMHYWPTTLRTRDVLRFFFDDAESTNIGHLQTKQSRPAEYFVGTKDDYFGAPWKQGQHVSLLHGGATQPILTATRDATQPKVRKGTMIYWSNGVWVKHTAKGPEKICPLSVSA